MRITPALALLLFITGAVPAADEPRPFLALRCESLDRLALAGEGVFAAAGAEREWKALRAKLDEFVPSLAGVDRGKPLGLYAVNRGRTTPLILVVPLSDAPAFLKGVGAEERAGRGPRVYQLQPGGSKTVVGLRLAHDHAYLSFDGPDVLAAETLPGPDRALGGEGLLGLTLDLAEMPQDFRRGLLRQVKDLLSALGERRPDESQAGRDFRRQLGALLGGWLDLGGQEGKSLIASLKVDPNGGVAFQLTLTGQERTALATSIEALGKQQSLFGGLKADQAAFAARLTAEPGKEPLASVLALVRQALGEGGKEQAALLALLQPTIEAGTADAVYQVRGPGGKDTYTLLAGLSIKKGDEIDRKLKALAKRSEAVARLFKPEEGAPKGTTLYRVTVSDRPRSLEALGDHPVYLAIRDDLLAVTAGAEGRKAMDELLALKAVRGPVTSVRLRPGRLAPLLGSKTPSSREGGLELTVEGGTRLRVEFRTDLDSLRLLAEAARKE